MLSDVEILRQIEIINGKKAQADAENKGWREMIREEIFKQDWRVEEFTAKTFLSETVYKRLMRKEEPGITLNSLVAICLGLQLDKDKSMKIIHGAGFAFKDSSKLHYYYKYFIDNHFNIHDADHVLMKAFGQSFGSHN